MFINPFRPVRFLSWSHHVPNWLGHSSSSSPTQKGEFNTPAAPCSLHSAWNITEATMHQESRRRTIYLIAISIGLPTLLVVWWFQHAVDPFVRVAG